MPTCSMRCVKHVAALQRGGKRVVIALWSEGARDRMSHVLRDHGLANLVNVGIVAEALATPGDRGRAGGARHRIRLRDRAGRDHQRAGHPRRPAGAAAPRRRKRREFHRRGHQPRRPAIWWCMSITASAASSGLQTIEAARRAARLPRTALCRRRPSCICRSKTSNCCRATARKTSNVELDRLGGGGWQTRKARMKNRIREIARRTDQDRGRAAIARSAEKLAVPAGMSTTSSARGFPYEETEDQQSAIDAALEDLASGRPMDRLVCGDVGFGKTEVALRAAFVAAMSGKQVAVVVPTTLLARQHYKTFTERFHGFPVKIGAGVASGDRGRSRADHARRSPTARSTSSSAPMRCSARTSSSRISALVIVDEEQHFGVAHKEKLKTLRAEVHVLTLTATPIPRTLAACADRRARSLAHRLAAGRPPGGAHLRLAVRSDRGARGDAARALSRRAVVLCLPADRGSRRRQGLLRQDRAGGEGRGGAWPDAADRARRHHVGLL